MNQNTVLFLCTGNSCRSQMAEAIVNARYPEWKAYSAGKKPAGYVHPNAIQALAEIGIPIQVNQNRSMNYIRRILISLSRFAIRQRNVPCSPERQGNASTTALWILPKRREWMRNRCKSFGR